MAHTKTKLSNVLTFHISLALVISSYKKEVYITIDRMWVGPKLYDPSSDLLHRLWLQVASPVQDGSARTTNILAPVLCTVGGSRHPSSFMSVV